MTAGIILLSTVEIPAMAGWTVVSLTIPTWAIDSRAVSVSSGQVGGTAYHEGGDYGSSYGHPVLWDISTGSWVDLHPGQSLNSGVCGVSHGQQVGYKTCVSWYQGNPVAWTNTAGLWSGTAASWVSLAPAGSSQSGAYATSGGKQVGWASFGGQGHAGMWSGTSASWVDLHPAQASNSSADGISDGQQVGTANIGGKQHASLWTGTSASWVDLNPAGSSESYATGVSDGQQVGYAYFDTTPHAGLWRGTSASWVDLNPAGATLSNAYGIEGGRQVGSTWSSNSGLHAALWSGTPDSMVDLHALLPTGIYVSSEASAIEVSGGETWIAGYAQRVSTGPATAVLWHYTPDAPVPEPSSLVVLASGLASLVALSRRKT